MRSEYFIYDGITSEDMGLYSIRLRSGMIPETYYAGGSIKEVSVPGRSSAYFQRFERSPLEFNITVSPLDGEWTPQLKAEVAEWLFKETYAPFQKGEDEGVIYYAICTKAGDLMTANGKGYVDLTFRCKDPYGFLLPTVQTLDLRDNSAGGTVIVIENQTNMEKYVYPQLEIEMELGENSFSIENISNGGETFELNFNQSPTPAPPLENEVIYVDNGLRYIHSNKNQVNRYAIFNRTWLKLVRGENTIKIKGKCILRVRTQIPIIR